MSSALSKDKLEEILEEIVSYQVELAEDPTLPNLGSNYIQSCISKCRQYQNRVHYYLQITKRHEKNLRTEMKMAELDLELKTNMKLADDQIVRNMPSSSDRKAVAMSMLLDEHRALTKIKLELLDVEETAKIIKSKYDDLVKCSSDIKLQRQLVMDDKREWGSGGEGYTRPQAKQDRTIAEGMPPPVASLPIEAPELLGNTEAEPLPIREDASEVSLIDSFFKKPLRPDVATTVSGQSMTETKLVDYTSLLE
jgi:hypothetical protein